MNPPNNPDSFDLDLELREALRRVEPGRDFSTLSYLPKPVNRWTPSRGFLALAAALILMVSIPVGVIRYQARQQRREEAGAELIKALEITQTKLQKTRQMIVRQLGRRNAI